MTMTWTEAVAAIAQGAINIDEGITEVEAGSRVHRGMKELCRHLSEHPERHAAPDLLEACRALVEPNPFYDWDRVEVAFNLAEKAIEKATGEAP